MLRWVIFGCALASASTALAVEPQSAAHNIAQKFAGTADPRPPVKIAETAKASENSSAPAAPSKPPAKAKSPERPSLDYEMDMLRRARAERAEQQKSSANTAPSPAAPPAAATGKIVVTPPAATQAAATPAAPTSPIETPKPAASQTAPAKQAEAQTAATPAPSAQPATTPPPAKTPSATPLAVATPALAATAAQATQASILLAIETGGVSTKGVNPQDFDPIICLNDICFISNGLSGDAIKIGKADALKLKSTRDASQDACKGKGGCVFRNVGVIDKSQLHVVDLGAASTETPRTYDAHIDATCKSADSELSCENPISTADFRLWLVPEQTAKSAGEAAIEDAVADGLPHRDVARDTDK